MIALGLWFLNYFFLLDCFFELLIESELLNTFNYLLVVLVGILLV